MAETALHYPACTITIFEARTGIFDGDRPELLTTWDELVTSFAHHINEKYFSHLLQQTPGALRHHEGANYLFADGHVQWLRSTAIRIEPTSDGLTPGFGI